MRLPAAILKSAATWLEYSKAQLHQDIFVLAEHDFKSSGYFVEFGATNGHDLSNTYLLETQFGWQGIVAEPAKSWHEALKKNMEEYSYDLIDVYGPTKADNSFSNGLYHCDNVHLDCSILNIIQDQIAQYDT